MILLLFLCLFFQNCLTYLWHLGQEQSKILWNRESFESALTNPHLADWEREKLKLVQEAREFAIQKLALNEKGGFEYFSKLDRNEIGWNVSASEELELESYTWWFPIAGRVPYKGFFREDLAKLEEKSLKEKGYDTRIRVIGGYSTLGWFSDPLLSPQLKGKDSRLVGLVFHEMAHATAYLPGDSVLNESYATYVEEKGVEFFFLEKEGKDSPTLSHFQREREKRKASLDLLKQYAEKLKLVYASNQSDEIKRSNKKDIILAFKNDIFRLGYIPTDKKKEFLEREWNNEDFLGALRYNSGDVSFERLFQEAGKDFHNFHQKVRDLFDLPSAKREEFLLNFRQSPSLE